MYIRPNFQKDGSIFSSFSYFISIISLLKISLSKFLIDRESRSYIVGDEGLDELATFTQKFQKYIAPKMIC
jgi:hypothetical protein